MAASIWLGSALSPSQLVVGHQNFSACGAAPGRRFGFGAGLRRRRQEAEQAASRPGTTRPSFRGAGGGDLVLSRCCIYCLLPVAYCVPTAQKPLPGFCASKGRPETVAPAWVS
jgi:hypothetical protein